MQTIQITGQVYNFQTEKNYDATLQIELNDKEVVTKILVPNVTNSILLDGVKDKTIIKSFDTMTFWMGRLGLTLESVNHDDIFKIADEKLRTIIIKLLNTGKLNYGHDLVKSEADRVFMEEFQSTNDKDFNFSDINSIVTEIQALYANGQYDTKKAQSLIFGAYLFSDKQEPLTSFSNIEITKSKAAGFKAFYENIITLHHRMINVDFAQKLRLLIENTLTNNKIITAEILEA